MITWIITGMILRRRVKELAKVVCPHAPHDLEDTSAPLVIIDLDACSRMP